MAVIGINPTVDFAFKLMLGSPDHARVTIHFLNAILQDRTPITQVEFLNPILGKEVPEEKLSVLDILATDNQGRKLNIEIQTSLPAGLHQRLTFYASRLFVEQIQAGEKYQRLRPAIVICVLTKTLLPNGRDLHSDFRLRDRQGKLFSDDIQVHTLELTKLTATRDNLVQATPTERWAYFFRNAESMTGIEIRDVFPDPEFVEAAGVLEMINQTPEQLEQYRARMKFQMDEIARLDYARQEGEKKGREEGTLLGRIATYQELLNISEPSPQKLATYDLSKLTELAKELQQQLRNRGH